MFDRNKLPNLVRRLRPSKSLGKLFADASEYISAPTYSLNSTYDSDTLRYPMKLEHFVLEVPDYFMPLDQSGVPVANYGVQGLQYYASRIAGYALACWNISIDDPDPKFRDAFMSCANWFASQENGLFYYNFDISDLRKPWISGLGQGEGMSVLMRAYRYTGDRRYLDVARQASELFLRNADQGGVMMQMPDGGLMIEEYVNSRTTHVLNGAIFGLVGLADFLDEEGVSYPELCKVRDDVVKSIAENLEQWSLGGWTVYNIDNAGFGARNGVTIYYHLLHIAQIRHLAQRFPQYLQFGEYAERWTRGAESRFQRLRGLGAKLFYRAVTGW